MLTLFKTMTGGEEWGQLDLLLRKVGLMYRLLFLFFLFFTVLGVLNIVTGLFCEGASESARQDRDARAAREVKRKLRTQRQLKEIFVAADANGDGKVDQEEFEV